MQAGEVLSNRFRLIEQVGKGGMGQVWKSEDTSTQSVVALKLLHPWLAQDDDYLARFSREVEISQRIVSSRVVRVFGFGRSEGAPYMVMEFVEGESLREYLRRAGTLSWEQASTIAWDVLRGLDAAHSVNVLHRDIKPGNIIVTDGRAKVADFGIAKATDLTGLTGSSTMLGTPAYMAPDDQESAQGDLYAVGCVVFEMLTGAPPFDGTSMQSILMRHARTPIDLSLVPEPARPFVAALTQKEPSARPATAIAAMALLKPPTGVDGNREHQPLRLPGIAPVTGIDTIFGGYYIVEPVPFLGRIKALVLTLCGLWFVSIPLNIVGLMFFTDA